MDAGQVGSRGVERPLITLLPHMLTHMRTHTQTTSPQPVKRHLKTGITHDRKHSNQN